jgi:hypothetical protein
MGIPEPTAFREQLVERSQVPAPILSKLESVLSECRPLGFGSSWLYTSKHSLIPGTGIGVELLHDSGEIAGKIVYASVGRRESLVAGLISLLNDGRILATSNKRPELNSAPEIELERMVGANFDQLLKRHRQRLSAGRARSAPVKFRGFDELADFEDRLSRINLDYQTRRGVWVEMSIGEIEALRHVTPPPLPRS